MHQREQERPGGGCAGDSGPDFQTPIYISQGLQERLEHGVIDSDTFEEEFHGLIAFDADGDGVADLSTWIGVGPTVRCRSRPSSPVRPAAA